MAATDPQWFFRRGELGTEGWQSVVDDSLPGWQHTGLRVAELDDGGRLTLDHRGVERIIIPLAGSFTVGHRRDADEVETSLNGRRSVFDGPTDSLYLGSQTVATIRGRGRVAIAESPTSDIRPWRHIRPEQTPVELRGAGRSSRQVHNLGTPEALDAARLIVCEVLTPAENWSSYPPHKHDEDVPGHETRLEEIYYFEAAPTADGGAPGDAAFGLFCAYSSAAGEIGVNAMVRSGDIALVPFGYHGPAVAAPGYDLYYLNVMAGPDPDRRWLITDDPAHTWVRKTWEGEPVDGRLPFPDRRGGEQ